MARYLTRNPNVAKSNTQVGAADNVPVQFYEGTYTATGAAEWVVLPDAGTVGVTLSGTGAWVATVEATDSPPDIVEAGTAVTYAWPLGTLTATTGATTLTGATAVRANVTTVGTNVKLTVRA